MKVFHQDISLLFQFIFSEYLITHRELQSLLHLMRQGKDISSVLLRLTGAVEDYIRLFALSYHDGSLAKLKSNCAYFMQSEEIPEEEAALMHSHADQAWLLCSECLYKKSEHLIQEALEQLESFGKILQRMIPYFKGDENVLYFILRHREQLAVPFGPQFVRNCFEQIYPEGLNSALKFLLDRYMARGFSYLIPIIENHFIHLCR